MSRFSVLSSRVRALGVGFALVAAVSCGGNDDESSGPDRDWQCTSADGEDPEYLSELGCYDDLTKLASEPLSVTIPGARSVKTVIDRVDGDTLYFQNTNLYPIHYDFASTHLDGGELPLVGTLADFNTTEYYSETRRFMLGAVTHYEGPDKFCYEIAPYDTASAEFVASAFRIVKEHTYFGRELFFHPTSAANEAVAAELPSSIPVITNDELYAGIDYQPLNLAESYGRLRFITAAELETEFVTFRDIVVLDHVPNDISVVLGIITEEFQTPLAHINVLSKNRGTPNMGLHNAYQNDTLRELDGQWVRFSVGASDWTMEPVEQAEADTWWDAHRPDAIGVPSADLTVTDLRDIEDTIDLAGSGGDLHTAISAAIPAFGGKATHFGALAAAELPDVPMPKAFAIPVYWYFQFLADNDLDTDIADMLDPGNTEFWGDPEVRERRLEVLRYQIMTKRVDPLLLQAVEDKLRAEYGTVRMKFRSSTNAEDLEGFTGAGLYTSEAAQLDDPFNPDSIEDAIRTVWASVWFFRAFEERSYRSIDHQAVGMALLVHQSFPAEEANGVALTNNPFDDSGMDPAFYINAQRGGLSVVLPDASYSTDEFLYYFDHPNQPTTYISHSNQILEGETVLTRTQTHELGMALDAIRTYFAQAYSQNPWWAMDVEWKFEGEPGMEPQLFIKQARPYGNVTN